MFAHVRIVERRHEASRLSRALILHPPHARGATLSRRHGAIAGARGYCSRGLVAYRTACSSRSPGSSRELRRVCAPPAGDRRKQDQRQDEQAHKLREAKRKHQHNLIWTIRRWLASGKSLDLLLPYCLPAISQPSHGAPTAVATSATHMPELPMSALRGAVRGHRRCPPLVGVIAPIGSRQPHATGKQAAGQGNGDA
jgi:hypothetical protein